MDLTEVEGLADLLSAQTEAQRQHALATAGGALRRRCDVWRADLLRSLSEVEAVLDFGDDEDIADEVAYGVLPRVRALQQELERAVKGGERGEVIREGVRVALVGAPNVGKSSLLNALAGRDVVIVSPIAGTTRDVVEVGMDLGGYKVQPPACHYCTVLYCIVYIHPYGNINKFLSLVY